MSEAAKQAATGPVLLEEHSGAVLTLRLNRPEKLNALNWELARALLHSLLRAGQDSAVRAIVMTGAGRAFSAGGDIGLLRDLRMRNATKELEPLLVAGKDICLAIASMPKPVIAAVNGPAAGGGMNLALAADMRIASDQARFAQSFAQIGLYPDFGGTYFLPRIVGHALASELFYTAEILTAEDALRMGIVNHVYPAAQFEEEMRKLAERMAGSAPLPFRDAKHATLGNDRKALEAALDEEIRLQIHCFNSEDCLEGLNAFLEKRKPNFKGH
jgi:2-(1,2-epoxy-1,2-dihydrophenyl)acetyl-CoA isomerase